MATQCCCKCYPFVGWKACLTTLVYDQVSMPRLSVDVHIYIYTIYNVYKYTRLWKRSHTFPQNGKKALPTQPLDPHDDMPICPLPASVFENHRLTDLLNSESPLSGTQLGTSGCLKDPGLPFLDQAGLQKSPSGKSITLLCVVHVSHSS